jgi:hypothetical protein
VALIQLGVTVYGPFTAKNNYVDITALTAVFYSIGGSCPGGSVFSGNIDMTAVFASAFINEWTGTCE